MKQDTVIKNIHLHSIECPKLSCVHYLNCVLKGGREPIFTPDTGHIFTDNTFKIMCSDYEDDMTPDKSNEVSQNG